MDIKRFLGNLARMTLAVGALSVSAFAGADEFSYYHQPMGDWNNCCPPQCCPPPCCPQTCSDQCCPAPACAWGYNPPAYLRCCNQCCDSFCDTLGARVDFLWWRASEDCLELGSEEFVEGFPTTVEGTFVENCSNFRKPKFKYDPGFRLGLSHYSPCNCFDVALNWTHFHTRASVHGESFFEPNGLEGSPYTVFVPCWERFTNVYPDFACGHWTLNMDLLDLEFGHKYYVACCFVLRPHIGLRGARINQKYRVFSTANRTEFTLPGLNSFESHVSARNNFLAIGPRIGLDMEIDLGCGLSLVGEAGASLLFGRFHRHAKEDLLSFDPGSTPTTTDSFGYCTSGGCSGSGSERTSRATTDLAIGLEWNHCFTCCNRSHPVSFAIMWEHHAFFNMNNFNFHSGGYDPSIEPAGFPLVAEACCCCKTGDLYTQGLTVSLNYGF